jgi:hypothetical protein
MEVLEGQPNAAQMSFSFDAQSQGEPRTADPLAAKGHPPSVISLEDRRFTLGRERVLQRLFDSGLLHLKMN